MTPKEAWINFCKSLPEGAMNQIRVIQEVCHVDLILASKLREQIILSLHRNEIEERASLHFQKEMVKELEKMRGSAFPSAILDPDRKSNQERQVILPPMRRKG